MGNRNSKNKKAKKKESNKDTSSKQEQTNTNQQQQQQQQQQQPPKQEEPQQQQQEQQQQPPKEEQKEAPPQETTTKPDETTAPTTTENNDNVDTTTNDNNTDTTETNPPENNENTQTNENNQNTENTENNTGNETTENPPTEETNQENNPTTEPTAPTETVETTENQDNNEQETGTEEKTEQNNEENTSNNNDNEEKVEWKPEVDENGLFKFLDGVVTRREINSMSNEEQERFMDAIHTMSKNENGPGTSHFFRIAGYHGQPRPIYCSHGVETFPGWHRIYLKHFEDHLRLADRQNGNDGNIGLPYWDWTENRELPKILRSRWNEFPKDLFPPEVRAPRLTRANDNRISRNIRQWGVAEEANDCLLAVQHWVHASTGNEWASPYPSLESPHNSIHGIVGGNGGPMGSVAWAAFDVAFWLHHCNVDRIYEKYIELETDSHDEFESYQDTQTTDLFEIEFRPFNRLYQNAYHPRDTFSIKDLGFEYEKLPPTPKQELRQRPTLVVYPQVKVSEFESKCYQVHVFLVDKTKENEFQPPKNEDDFDNNPNYAGTRMIFGRGMECENCATRPPYDIIVDVSKPLRELGISRYNVKILTYVFETNTTEEVYMPHTDTPLPDPYITGPLFEDSESNLQQSGDDDEKENDEVTRNEIMQLQRYLKRYGEYDGNIDGSFGPVTQQAVKDYQKAFGLLEDGIVGPLTKKSILNNKRCSNVDGFANNDVKDQESTGERTYNVGDKLTYSLGIVPGYLKRDRVLKLLASCFEEWGNHVNISYSYSEESEVDIKVEFNRVSAREENSILRFDGVGGVLGHSGKNFVYFDIAERWEYGYDFENNKPDNSNISNLDDPMTWHRGQPKISFFYVLLHEIGHTLGLDHSPSGKDVMGPYYTPQLTTLQENDINRLKSLYSDEQQQEEPPQEEQPQEEQQNEEPQENQEEQPQEEQPQEEQPQEEQPQEEQPQEEQPQEEQPQEEQPQEEPQENQENPEE